MSRRHKRRKPMADINVVPYIDVMLVLLVIFMVTAPLLTQGVKVDLPEASAEPIEDPDSEPLVVSVDSVRQNRATAILRMMLPMTGNLRARPSITRLPR